MADKPARKRRIPRFWKRPKPEESNGDGSNEKGKPWQEVIGWWTAFLILFAIALKGACQLLQHLVSLLRNLWHGGS